MGFAIKIFFSDLGEKGASEEYQLNSPYLCISWNVQPSGAFAAEAYAKTPSVWPLRTVQLYDFAVFRRTFSAIWCHVGRLDRYTHAHDNGEGVGWQIHSSV